MQDGLHPDRVNENQGAESTLSFLMALLDMQSSTETNAKKRIRNEGPILNPNTATGLRCHDSLTVASMPELPFSRATDRNPILSRDHWPYPINSVFNAGAVRLADGDTLLSLPRGRPARHFTSVRRAFCQWYRWMAHRSGTDAGCKPASNILKKSGASKIPASPTSQNSNNTRWRTLRLRVAVPEFHWLSPKTSKALSDIGVIMPPEDKDAACCPEESTAAGPLIHRPVTTLGAHMWISYSPDLRHWGSHKVILEARRGGWWDANKIGLCSPPIETAKGWLMIYHGVRQTASGKYLSTRPRAL